MIKPSDPLGGKKIERSKEWCFKEDFPAAGPSIYRVLEARLLGFCEDEESPNPLLRAKADYTPASCATPTRVFLAGRVSAPTRPCGGGLAILERRISTPNWAKPALGQRLSPSSASADGGGWTG